MEYLAPMLASNINQSFLIIRLLVFLMINNSFLYLYPLHMKTLTLADKLDSI